MLEMGSAALEANLQTSHKIVSYSDAFLFSLIFLLWLLPSVHQWFEGCSGTYYPCNIPTNKKSMGFKSGACGAHSTSHFVLISLSCSLSLMGVCVASSCCTHFISIYLSASSQWCPNLSQHWNIALRIHSLRYSIFVFEQILAENGMFINGTDDLHNAACNGLSHADSGCTPLNIVFAVYMSWKQQVSFIREPNMI